MGFGLQWQRYRKTQLDSYTGQPISERRLVRCLGHSLDELQGKKVLEVGSGAGRFTELLLRHCEALVSVDYSDAVEANMRNCSSMQRPYLLLQADVTELPFPPGLFDVVVCLGVIQHTPSPERTIEKLAEQVRPGGILCIDHYIAEGWSKVGRYLTLAYPLRSILKRLPSEEALKYSIAISEVCDPVRKVTCKYPIVDRIACRLFPSICHYRRPELQGLSEHQVREWNELDTHDALTDFYKHLYSPDEVQEMVERSGLTVVSVERAGNGVEIRATAPNS